MNHKIKALVPAPKKVREGACTFEIGRFAGNFPVFEKDEAIDAPLMTEAEVYICRSLEDLAAMSGKKDVASADGTGLLASETFSQSYRIVFRVDPCMTFEEAQTASEHSALGLEAASEEIYEIETGQERTVITGKSPAGVFYGAITLAQLMDLEGEKVLVPEVYLKDWPDFKERGVTVECRYGTEFMTKQQWFDMIDYYAALKLNRVQIAVYNCWGRQYDGIKTQCLYLPIRKYPKLQTPKNIKYYSVAQRKWIHKENILPKMYEEDFFEELIQYAAKKNILIRPHLCCLGHNTLIPEVFPEISAIGEDGKPTLQGFCTRNEKTYEIMLDILDEVIDRYLLPNGIHQISLGLDEVGPSYICHCDKCKDSSHAELMLEYIIRLCKHVKSKGMDTVIISYDMLFHIFNTVNEEMKELFVKEDIHDVVKLSWWTYEDPSQLFYGRSDDVNNLFRSVIRPATGYYHWALPTENNENIRACAKLAWKLEFEGMEAYSAWEYCFDKNFLTLADVAWNVDHADDMEEFEERYAYRCYPDKVKEAMQAFQAMSNIMKDETRVAYLNRAVWKLESYFYCYRKWDEPEKSRNFPGEAYKLITEKEEEYLAYLHYLKENAGQALQYFEHNGESSCLNETWRLLARHYYTLADEYLTLYGFQKSYNDKTEDCLCEGEACAVVEPKQVIQELERLIVQREALMLLAERTRMDVNQYTYLRGMSWFRQFMLDLLDYFRKEVPKGNRPKLDMTDLHYATGEILEFLQ